MSERQKPTVGDTVHYVSYGTPGGEYASQCRAAIVTEVATDGQLLLRNADAAGGGRTHSSDEVVVGLAVLNPTGMFFNRAAYHEGDVGHDHAGEPMKALSYRGGSWHWPERA